MIENTLTNDQVEKLNKGMSIVLNFMNKTGLTHCPNDQEKEKSVNGESDRFDIVFGTEKAIALYHVTFVWKWQTREWNIENIEHLFSIQEAIKLLKS